MSLIAPPSALVVSGWLPAANPTARLLAATAVGALTLAALDPLTPALVITAVVVAARSGGIPLRLLALRAWPLALSAGGVGLSNALLGTGGPQAGLATALRVVAAALPGVAVLLVTDPTDLADSLVQQAHVPPRFAYGALAALRLLPLLAAEWRTIAAARRARGLDSGANPVAALRLFVGQVFALLVAAIRRGTRLATAMDARGFDSAAERTVARPQLVRRTDRLLVVGATALPLLVMALGAWLGTLHLLGG